MFDIRRWSPRIIYIGIRLLAALGLLFVVVTVLPVDSWWASALAGNDYAEKGDVLIVLAGSMAEDGSMGWSSYLRTTYADMAYRSGGFKEVVVSGGIGPNSSVPVSIAMGDYLRFKGVPANAIHLETLSRTTRENALFSKALINAFPGNKVLLTSDYHMFRARRVFAKLGIEVRAQPVPDVIKRSNQWGNRWPAFLELVGETVKIGYYWARGWI